MTESEVTGIVSGVVASGIRTDVVPYRSGDQDLGSATKPWKDIYLTSGSVYLGESHIFINPDANLCVDNNIHSNAPLVTSGQVSGMLAAPKNSFQFTDATTSATVTLSVRNGGLTVTDPFTESVSNVDLGATTPDPGTITNLSINGGGRYRSAKHLSLIHI